MVEHDRGILAIHEQHDKVRRQGELRPNSILTLAPIINERFGSVLSDDTPIEKVVRISRNSDMGNTIIELTPIWDGIGQDHQRGRITTIFDCVTFTRRSGLTIGRIRELAKTGEIRKIVGLSITSEVFLADSFKKREIT
jgi:hypothetical protein